MTRTTTVAYTRVAETTRAGYAVNNWSEGSTGKSVKTVRRSTSKTNLTNEGYILGPDMPSKSSKSSKRISFVVEGHGQISKEEYKNKSRGNQRISFEKEVRIMPSASLIAKEVVVSSSSSARRQGQVSNDGAGPSTTDKSKMKKVEQMYAEKGLDLKRLLKKSCIKTGKAGVAFEAYDLPKGFQKEDLNNSQNSLNMSSQSVEENPVSPAVQMATHKRHQKKALREKVVIDENDADSLLLNLRRSSRISSKKQEELKEQSSEENVHVDQAMDTEDAFDDENDSFLCKMSQMVEEEVVLVSSSSTGPKNGKPPERVESTTSFPMTSTPIGGTQSANVLDQTPRRSGLSRTRSRNTLNESNSKSTNSLFENSMELGNDEGGETPRKHLRFDVLGSPIECYRKPQPKPSPINGIVGEFPLDEDDDVFSQLPADFSTHRTTTSVIETDSSADASKNQKSTVVLDNNESLESYKEQADLNGIDQLKGLPLISSNAKISKKVASKSNDQEISSSQISSQIPQRVRVGISRSRGRKSNNK